MTKLTETQSIILTAGAQRPDNIALPLPKGLAGAAAKMSVTKMIEHGWLQEVDASSSRGDPLWRETGDGHGTTLVVTDAGLLAIGIEPVVVKTMNASRVYSRLNGSDKMCRSTFTGPSITQNGSRSPVRFAPACAASNMLAHGSLA